MTAAPRPIREWHSVDTAVFRDEILALHEPAVLRGAVADWSVVREAKTSPKALCAYLLQCDAGRPAQVLFGDPSIKGLFFYEDDLRTLNFERRQDSFRGAIEKLLTHLDDSAPPAISIQAAGVRDALPRFAQENRLGLVDASITPRIWVNNATTVAAHFDPKENVACVAGGRRRFTLFPPDQVSNLYIGPLECTLAGPWISLADVDNPDFARHPRFKEALASAQVAELGPGDAIYIPYLWWHHVRSLEGVNVLVNYWWNAAKPGLGSPFDSLYHALLALSALPPEQRDAWRAMFDHFVFHAHGEPAAHIPPDQRGVLGAMTPENMRKLREMVLEGLSRA